MNAAILPPKRRPPQDEFGIRVKQQLIAMGQTVTEMAARLGFNRTTVSIAINHPTMHPTVKAAIRRHLGI